jgi:hypothetical protein
MAGPLRRAALGAILPATILVSAMLLAACGTSAAPTVNPTHHRTASPTHRTPAAPASNALCLKPDAVVSLMIREQSLQNGVQEQAGQPPGSVSVPTVDEARAVARAVCELPPMSAAQQGCHSPVLVSSLLLTFSTKDGALPVVTIQASGCSRVTGAGRVRWAKATPALTQALHAIVHHEPPVVFAN